jgi:hypothetical protein
MPSPTTWQDAVSLAMSNAPGKRTAIGVPRISNTEASGLILFGAAVAAYAKATKHPFDFDWYGFGLPALGWRKPGDKFLMTAEQQQAEYPSSSELWSALQAAARQLDEQGVPFKLVRSPLGTPGTYAELARVAWERMKRESPQASRSPARSRPSAPRPSSADMERPPPRAGPRAMPASEPEARRPKESEPGDSMGAGILLALALYVFSES